MAKKLLSVTVKGNEKKYCFNFYGDPKYIPEWEADGLEVVEILNTIPIWVVDAGLTKPWIFMQDIFNFKNPFGRQ